MITSSEDKDRGRLIDLAKKATSEEVQNHLDAFDGNKIIVDFDGESEDDSDSRESPARGFLDASDNQNKAFEDGLRD
jgi:hypothetical protein